MVSCCNRRLYKGNSYEICLPITDSGVTSVKFYTTGDVVVEKEGEIVDDTMCFELAKDELDLLPDGVLRYSYDGFDSSAGYVVVTPRNYSASTLDDLLEDAFDSGYTAGQEGCSAVTCEGVYESGYTSGYTDGQESVDCTEFYNSGVTDGFESGYTSGHTDGYESGYTAGQEDCSGSSCNLQASKTVYLESFEWAYRPGTEGHWARAPIYYISGFPIHISADTGYDGMEEIQLTGGFNATEAFDDGFSKGLNSGYTSGLTDGYNSGYTDGQASVDCTDYYNSGVTDGFGSGYTSGYSGGYEEGLADCSGITNADLIANLQGDYFVIPEGTSYLRDNAFYAVQSYSSITIPNSVSGIGIRAFYLNSLTSVTIPDSVVSIDKGAFSYNYKMQYAVIGSGVTSIGENCFYNNSGMSYMIFEGTVPPTLASQQTSLGQAEYTFPIYVPCESVDAYKTAFGQYYAPRVTCAGPEPQSAATAITISVPQNLEPGDTGSTTVTVSPSGATTNFSYTSTDNSVATVDSNGVITAVGTGTTNICVTDSISQLSACTQMTIVELDYSTKYLTIEAQYDGQMSIPAGNDRFYRKNGGEWQSANGNIEVSNGDKIEVKASGAAPYFFSGALMDTCIVYGNIMSLFYGDDFQDKLVFPVSGSVWPESDSNCIQIFDGCMGLTDASNLVLPATAVTRRCYDGMFWGCRNLQHAPKILPATSLAPNCYAHMFSGCEELLDAPELPATELAEMCYFTMFTNCYKLTKAPVLPARVLAADCYEYMFYMYNPQENNPRLNYIECLATDLHAENSTSGWVFGVQATGTFVKNANMTAWTRGNDGIPTGWTVVDAQL